MDFFGQGSNITNVSQVQLTAMSASNPGNQVDLGTVTFSVGYSNDNPYYYYTHPFTPAQLAMLGSLSAGNWDRVTITATSVANSVLLLQNVEMDLTTAPPTGLPGVPIPPTAWLLGSGLVGLVGLRRRFKK